MYSVASCNPARRLAEDGGRGEAARQPGAEWELLLACAAVVVSDQQLRRVQVLAQQALDWELFLQLTETHGVVPLACERLRESSAALPHSVMAKLVRTAAQNAQQALWLTNLLFTVCDCLERHDIPALAYKGPVLAEILFGSVTSRQYADIDILIHPSDVPKARMALQANGFMPSLTLSPPQEIAHIASGYEYAFDQGPHSNVVELQWRVLPCFYCLDFDIEGLFERAQTVQVAGRPIRTLANEDLLLVLCAHAAKHAWSKLSWVREIANLSRLPGHDWPRIMRNAEHIGMLRILGISMRVADELFGSEAPCDVQNYIDNDREVQRIGAGVCRLLRSGEELPVNTFAYFRLMTDVRERYRDRFRFALRLATTPGLGEWTAVQLPPRMYPLYRLMRVGRLATRFMRWS